MADLNRIDGSGNFIYGASYVQTPPGVESTDRGTYIGRAKIYEDLPQPAIEETFGINYVDASVFGTLTDGSGTITQANVAQTVFAAKPQRNYLLFVNLSDTVMYVNIDGIATDTNSYPVLTGGQLSFESGFIPNGAVSVICASSGKEFVAKEG